MDIDKEKEDKELYEGLGLDYEEDSLEEEDEYDSEHWDDGWNYDDDYEDYDNLWKNTPDHD